MSVDDLKKKAKLSLDEMHDNKDVGNPETLTTGHPTNNKTKLMTVKNISHTEEKFNCKVTFNTSENKLYQFNVIYANRIVQKNKTDKSALFNEALDLLIEKEKERLPIDEKDASDGWSL